MCSTALEYSGTLALACDPHLQAEVWPSASCADLFAAVNSYMASRQSELAFMYGYMYGCAYRACLLGTGQWQDNALQ